MTTKPCAFPHLSVVEKEMICVALDNPNLQFGFVLTSQNGINVMWGVVQAKLEFAQNSVKYLLIEKRWAWFHLDSFESVEYSI